MARNGLVRILQKGLFAGFLVGSLALTTGCGGGGDKPAPKTNPTPVVNRAPVIASYTINPNNGTVPHATTHGWSISDPDNDALTCNIDVDNNGTNDYTINNCTSASTQLHTYLNAGSFTSKLTVSDGKGGSANMTANVTVNQPALEQIAFRGLKVIPGEGCPGDNCEDIYVANEDGSGVKRLTTHPAQDIAPAWSPDGKQNAFVTNRDTDTALYTMNAADGSNQARISGTLDYAHWPAWCSDGTIFFTSPFPGGIAKIKPDGTGFEQVVIDSTASHPSCSPDGKRIAFETKRDGNFEIYVKDLTTGTETNITNNPNEDGTPHWTNQDFVYFSSNRFGTVDIYRMKSDGSDVVQLTSDSGIETDPSVSSDGSKVAFAASDGINPFQVYRMKSDGSEITILSNDFVGSRYPAWKPKP